MSLDAAAIAKFKVAELKAELVARGLDNKGKKRPSNVCRLLRRQEIWYMTRAGASSTAGMGAARGVSVVCSRGNRVVVLGMRSTSWMKV